MRRREFVSLIGTAAISYPTWAKAEQSKLTVGFLSGGSPGAIADLDGFKQGLAEGGYYEGRNLAIEYRWADGQFARLPALSDDLSVSRRPSRGHAHGNSLPPARSAAA
jgi:putative tryptophan/tyrosine transport system substrate-binding protein